MNDRNLGKVFLIGAGPGDPGLFTLKGAKVLSQADVVIYDFLASPILLKYVRPDAEIIYAGKRGGDHTLAQDEINSIICEKAMQGSIVARLKGGDPFVFGRGGEEAQVLSEAGIPFEVVPGVTSAIAAPAYAGIPVTHRRFTPAVTFVTGHEDPEKERSMIDWDALASGPNTLVFFMGVKNLPRIAERLVKSGKDPKTPAAVIRWGTTPMQKTVVGNLENIADRVASSGIKAPAIIVVGEVVGIRPQLTWFENLPLFGKRIVVTRSRHQASDLYERLSDLGADCIMLPTIRVVPSSDPGPLDRAIETLKDYDWILFTSVNGVDLFFNRLFENGFDARAMGGLKTSCIGPATAKRLKGYGIGCDVLPESYVAESVAEAFSKIKITGKRILVPRAAGARQYLPEALAGMGAVVEEVEVYETVRDTSGSEDDIADLLSGNVDLVTFTSSSTVKNFAGLFSKQELQKIKKNVIFACIGPITAKTAFQFGLAARIVADRYTIPGLVDAICSYYSCG